MFDVTYFTEDNKIANTLVVLPAEKDWQWRKDDEDNFFPVKDANADPVELDLSVLDQNAGGFSKTDKQILLAKGKVHTITVKVMDVGDPNFGKVLIFIAKKTLPEIFKGVIGFASGAVGSKLIATLITDLNKGDDLSNILINALEKETKDKSGDKILFKGGEDNIDASAAVNVSITGTGKGKNKDTKGAYEIGLNIREI
jgi:hypothetical protein